MLTTTDTIDSIDIIVLDIDFKKKGFFNIFIGKKTKQFKLFTYKILMFNYFSQVFLQQSIFVIIKLNTEWDTGFFTEFVISTNKQRSSVINDFFHKNIISFKKITS